MMELLERPSRTGPPPTSAVRDAREAMGLNQLELARRAGISQAYLSEIETGKVALKSETAYKLAPALKADPAELEFAESLSSLQRAAMRGTLDPRLLVETIMEFSAHAPDSEVAENLTDALLQVLKKALQTYQETAGTEERAPGKVTTKSAEGPRPDRDSLGRRRNKPFGGA